MDKVNEALSYLSEEDKWQKEFYDKKKFQVLTDNKIQKDLLSVKQNMYIFAFFVFLGVGIFLIGRLIININIYNNWFEIITELLLSLVLIIIFGKLIYTHYKNNSVVRNNNWTVEEVVVKEKIYHNYLDDSNHEVIFSNGKSLFVKINDYEQMDIGFQCYYINVNSIGKMSKDIFYRKDKFKYIGNNIKTH